MIRSRRQVAVVTVAALVIGVSVACGPVSLPFSQPSADAGAPAAVAPVAVRAPANATPTPSKSRPAGPRQVPVKRDALVETLPLDGVVMAQSQMPILYSQRGIVDVVLIKAGQSVKQGDDLLDLNSTDISRALDTARTRLQTWEANLAQAQAQESARQQTVAQNAAADQQLRQQAVLDLEVQLTRAQANLASVQAGKSPNDRVGAQTAVDEGTAKVQQMQHILDDIMGDPDPAAIRSAEREVQADQLALTKARGALDGLTKGPDPTAVRAAQAQVQRAHTQLQIAQAAKIDPKADPAVAKLQHDAAIQDAETAVQAAEDALASIKQLPPDTDVQTAKQHVLDAQDTLSTAQAKLAAIQDGPDQKAIDKAQGDLSYWLHFLGEAKQNADEVNSHPTPAELSLAQDSVRKTQTALDNARRSQPQSIDGGGPDMAALQTAVEQARSDVSNLEQTLESTHLRAPFDGTVVAVRLQAGDALNSSRPVVILAKPGAPVVRVQLDDTQAGRLVAGQLASVQLGPGDPTAMPLDAVVAAVNKAGQGGATGATADFQVKWVDGQLPRFGTAAQVIVTLDQKQDVLVVPKGAVHTAGGRATVEVQDGSLRRMVTVQVGISTADSIEIVNGLAEGQMVLVAASG